MTAAHGAQNSIGRHVRQRWSLSVLLGVLGIDAK
jgi:hypothetical protein